jgi:hypothetical protein
VEVADKVASSHEGIGSFPGVILRPVTSPSYQVFHFASSTSQVEHIRCSSLNGLAATASSQSSTSGGVVYSDGITVNALKDVDNDVSVSGKLQYMKSGYPLS